MKKTVLILLAVVILAVGGGVYYLLTNLNSIVEAAIEKYGSEAVQTAVRVDKVDIKLTEGKAAISGLTVANPEGFAAPNAFSLGDISVNIDLNSLGKQPIVIKEIGVRAPEVFYEINRENKDNLRILQRNLAGDGTRDTPSRDPASGQTRLLIRTISLEDARLHADVLPLEQSHDVVIPTLRMTDLGAPDGARPPELARQVLNELLDRVRARLEEEGLGEARRRIDARKGELKEQADRELEEEKAKAREKVRGLLDR